MKKFKGNIVVYDFLQTYHKCGEYEFKIVLNPKVFKSSHEATVEMLSPNREPMELVVNKWGRKIICSFKIDDNISDGVCVVKINLVANSGKDIEEILHCWIIK